jgi:type IVB pilus formation R64 PilN family outer membrane protein
MNKIGSGLRLLCVFLFAFLVGCNSATYNQTEANIADTKQREAAARAHMDSLTKASAPLVIKDGMYVDATPVSLERQPDWLKNSIVIKGDQLPFSYYTRVITSAADKNVLTKYQSGLDPSILVSINYTGTVKGALDLLAAKTGYVYNIQRGGTVYWQAFITRTYSIAFMPGSSDYLMGQPSGGGAASSTSGGATDAAAAEYSSLSAKTLSVWTDVESTVKQLLSADGKVFVSQSSTSVTVRDKPSNVELVGQYVRNLNKSLSQQVYVKVEVLDVSLTNDYNFGINWQAVESAFAHSNFIFNANYGSPLSITPLTGGNIPNYGLRPSTATATLANAGATSLLSAIVSALNQQGKVSVVAQPRIVCMNNQVSAIRIINTQQYIQSVSNTSVPASGGSSGSQTVNNVSTITSQITPATLVTGLTLYVLPKILGEKVYLQINVDMSQNQSISTLCAQSGSSAGTCADSSYVIQSPHVTEKIFNQRSVLVSGETLILSGLKQVTNSTGAMQLFNLQELGGKASTQTNNDTVILVTPYILQQHGTG